MIARATSVRLATQTAEKSLRLTRARGHGSPVHFYPPTETQTGRAVVPRFGPNSKRAASVINISCRMARERTGLRAISEAAEEIKPNEIVIKFAKYVYN